MWFPYKNLDQIPKYGADFSCSTLTFQWQSQNHTHVGIHYTVFMRKGRCQHTTCESFFFVFFESQQSWTAAAIACEMEYNDGYKCPFRQFNAQYLMCSINKVPPAWMDGVHKHELRPYRRLHAPIMGESYGRAVKTKLNSATIACVYKSVFVNVPNINTSRLFTIQHQDTVLNCTWTSQRN